MKVRNITRLPALRFLDVCNVLIIHMYMSGPSLLIVYRLYDVCLYQMLKKTALCQSFSLFLSIFPGLTHDFLDFSLKLN